MHLETDPTVPKVFEAYPGLVREKLYRLRQLILEAAEEAEDIQEVQETLKWGEPSYLTRGGSTIRIDWKEKQPGQYAIYFKCTSKLITTFRLQYPGTFRFEGQRAMLFQMDEAVPEEALKACITAALRYHKVKHLPNLGME